MNLGDPAAARERLEAQAREADRLGDDRCRAEAALNLGMLEKGLGRYAEAEAACRRGLELYERIRDPEGEAQAFNQLGGIADDLGQYYQALDWYFRAARLVEQRQDRGRFMRLQSNIGVIYYKLKEYDAALACYTRALEFERPLKKAQRLANLENNIGLVLFEQGRYDEAATHFKNSLALEEQVGSPAALANVLISLGEVTRALGRPPSEAMDYWQRALPLAIQAEDRWGEAQVRADMAVVLASANQLSAALREARRSLALATAIGVPEIEMTARKTLADILARQGHAVEALAQFRAFHELYERTFNDEKRRRTSDLKARYESERHLREMEALRQQQTIQGLEAERSRLQVRALSGGVLLLGILVLLTLLGLRQKSRSGKLIARKNEELSAAYNQLEKTAHTDPLTGLENRRSIYLRFEIERNRSARTRRAFAIVLGDIDHFKSINDSWGHEAGDRVLTTVAAMMRDALRREDAVGRWGGEEFIWILPETPTDGARMLAERFRSRLQEKPIEAGPAQVTVTMTFGISPCDHSMDFEDAIRSADQALYRGKELGRDRVELACVDRERLSGSR